MGPRNVLAAQGLHAVCAVPALAVPGGQRAHAVDAVAARPGARNLPFVQAVHAEQALMPQNDPGPHGVQRCDPGGEKCPAPHVLHTPVVEL